MSACDLRYVSHKIYDGKPELEGLPATFATEQSPAETLEITMIDKHAGLEAVLIYTAFENLDAITRSVVVKNIGNMRVLLQEFFQLVSILIRINMI